MGALSYGANGISNLISNYICGDCTFQLQVGSVVCFLATEGEGEDGREGHGKGKEMGYRSEKSKRCWKGKQGLEDGRGGRRKQD